MNVASAMGIPMSDQPKLPPCDCLNWCGDDPWLQDGRAEPCQDRKDRERREAEGKVERAHIVAVLDHLADSAVKHGTVSVTGEVMTDLRAAVLRRLL